MIKTQKGKRILRKRKGYNSKIEEEEQILKNAIEDQAREDERPLASNFTLKKILGGDIFSAILKKQYWSHCAYCIFHYYLYIKSL